MVEIVAPKPKISIVAFHWPLWISVILFVLIIASFAGFKIYLSQLHNQIIDINNQIRAEAAKVSADDENTVANLSDSLASFSSLVSNHTYFSATFDTINSLTHPKVAFIKFDADKTKGIITLKGSTQNYTTLAKQIVAFRDYQYIKSVDVKGINFTDQGLSFELALGVDQKIFLKLKQ